MLDAFGHATRARHGIPVTLFAAKAIQNVVIHITDIILKSIFARDTTTERKEERSGHVGG